MSASLSRAAAKAWHHDQVTLADGVNALAGEHLGGPGDDVEQLAGAGVMVRRCPGRAVQQGDPLAAERAAGGAAVGVQPSGHRRPAEDLGIGLAHEDHVMRGNRPGHTTHLLGDRSRAHDVKLR